MTEQQFTYEIRECCKRIFNDGLKHSINDDYIENLHFKFHEDKVTWVEYFGNRLRRYDKKAAEIMGRVINAVCTKHNIIFYQYL